MKKLNWYYAIDVLAALFVVFAFLARKYKVFNLLQGIDLLLCAAFIFVEYRYAIIPSKVTNKSNEPILAKPETENEPVQIDPQGEMYGIDGIKVGGRVYKLHSGTHVEVKENGKIVTKSISGKLANNIKAGYLNQSPDSNWDELFNA